MASRQDRQKKRSASEIPISVPKGKRTRNPPASSSEPSTVTIQIPQQQPRPTKPPQQKIKKFAIHGASEWFKKFGNKRELLVEHDVDDKVDKALKVK